MNLDIRGHHMQTTGALQQHIERRIGTALKRLTHRVQDVVIRISEGEGQPGGHEKHCRLQVHLSGAGTVFIDECDRDMYVAIDRAASRAKEAVRRSIKRGLERRRH